MNTACEYYDDEEPDGSNCVLFQYPSFDECDEYMHAARKECDE